MVVEGEGRGGGKGGRRREREREEKRREGKNSIPFPFVPSPSQTDRKQLSPRGTKHQPSCHDFAACRKLLQKVEILSNALGGVVECRVLSRAANTAFLRRSDLPLLRLSPLLPFSGGRCKSSSELYCSKGCQSKRWKVHKKSCGPNPKKKQAAAKTEDDGGFISFESFMGQGGGADMLKNPIQAMVNDGVISEEQLSYSLGGAGDDVSLDM